MSSNNSVILPWNFVQNSECNYKILCLDDRQTQAVAYNIPLV